MQAVEDEKIIEEPKENKKAEIPAVRSKVKVLYEEGWSFGTVTAHVDNSSKINVRLDGDDVEDTLEYDQRTVVLVNDSCDQSTKKAQVKLGDQEEIFYEEGWSRGVVKSILKGGKVQVVLEDGAEDEVEIDGVWARLSYRTDDPSDALSTNVNKSNAGTNQIDQNLKLQDISKPSGVNINYSTEVCNQDGDDVCKNYHYTNAIKRRGDNDSIKDFQVSHGETPKKKEKNIKDLSQSGRCRVESEERKIERCPGFEKSSALKGYASENMIHNNNEKESIAVEQEEKGYVLNSEERSVLHPLNLAKIDHKRNDHKLHGGYPFTNNKNGSTGTPNDCAQKETDKAIYRKPSQQQVLIGSTISIEQKRPGENSVKFLGKNDIKENHLNKEEKSNLSKKINEQNHAVDSDNIVKRVHASPTDSEIMTSIHPASKVEVIKTPIINAVSIHDERKNQNVFSKKEDTQLNEDTIMTNVCPKVEKTMTSWVKSREEKNLKTEAFDQKEGKNSANQVVVKPSQQTHSFKGNKTISSDKFEIKEIKKIDKKHKDDVKDLKSESKKSAKKTKATPTPKRSAKVPKCKYPGVFRRPKKGDKIQILDKRDGWVNATITKVKKRKKGQEKIPILIMIERDSTEHEIEYDSDKVVMVSGNPVERTSQWSSSRIKKKTDASHLNSNEATEESVQDTMSLKSPYPKKTEKKESSQLLNDGLQSNIDVSVHATENASNVVTGTELDEKTKAESTEIMNERGEKCIRNTFKIEKDVTSSNRPQMSDEIAQSSKKPFHERVEDLVSLVMASSNGKPDNEKIEHILSNLVESYGPCVKSEPKPIYSSSNAIPDPDEDDYDADSDPNCQTLCDVDSKSKVPCGLGERPEVTIKSLQQQRADLKAKHQELSGIKDFHLDLLHDNWKCLDDIPLGREGARMLVTFGDGRNPRPDTVAAVLMVARRCLQHAIKDARALRRKMQEDYRRARVVMSLHNASTQDKSYFDGIVDCEIDSEMCYRALNGRDRLAFDLKCGFEVSQLEILFPEEMNEYQKWAKMHQEYKKKNNTKDDSNDVNNPSKFNDKSWVGGHLRDRLAQFDVRTDQMIDRWYILFAEVRKGSFIRGGSTKEDREWNEHRKKFGRSCKNAGRWESLPASSVQFLHWLGFNERSSLALPNENVIQALAFLGYDFVGKIVEKAIMLRYLAKKEDKMGNTQVVLQLQGNEQLEIKDIIRALNDTTLNTTALYNASNSLIEDKTAQIYLGPGFEDRLELELDNIVGNGKKNGKEMLSETEKEIRKKEDELFEKLAAPPTLLGGVMDVLGSDSLPTKILEQRLEAKKKRKGSLEWIEKLDAVEKKRRRPKKDVTKS